MPEVGFEPTRREAPPASKAGACTSYATPALEHLGHAQGQGESPGPGRSQRYGGSIRHLLPGAPAGSSRLGLRFQIIALRYLLLACSLVESGVETQTYKLSRGELLDIRRDSEEIQNLRYASSPTSSLGCNGPPPPPIGSMPDWSASRRSATQSIPSPRSATTASWSSSRSPSAIGRTRRCWRTFR